MSGDIWLERVGDRIAVSNVVTGRRALLDERELQLFTAGSPGEDLSRRLRAADLLVEENCDLPSPTPPWLRAVDRMLAESWECSRRAVAKREPDALRRLEVAEGLCAAGLQQEFQNDVRSIFRTVRAFVESGPVGVFDFQADFLQAAWRRPDLEFEYGQLPCMPETTQRRVELAPPGARCLVLGDDDLIGLMWTLSRETPCDLFELDPRLLEFMEPFQSDRLKLFQRDLTEGLPEEFHGRYEAIFTDPMYGKEGMDMFLTCCAQGLSDAPEARLYLTTRPDLIEDGANLSERLAARGMRIETRRENFSRYRLPQQTRDMALDRLNGAAVPIPLVHGLLQVPYYYADMLEVVKI